MSTYTAEKPRALVVGLGVSGTASAISLTKAGWDVLVVERAAARRRGGYFIGLSNAGRAPAERLGMMDHLHNRLSDKKVYEIDRQGKRQPGIGFADLPVKPWMLMRGDVEAAANAALPESVDVQFSTVPVDMDQDENGVDVTLRHGSIDRTERFDLVVGADGLRSTVRSLAFGPAERYLHKLNYMIAAFELPAEPPGMQRGEGAILTEEGRSLWIFPFADHAPTALFTYRTENIAAEFAKPAAQRLREVYGIEPLGPVLKYALDAFEASDEHLFDTVEQVRLDSWHRGRVVLVGDSAWCVSLYAGMGVSAGIAGADLLGTMLSANDDVEAALVAWEKQLRPYIEEYQKAGIQGRVFFNPSNRKERVQRSLMLRARRSKFLGPILNRIAGRNELTEMRETDIADPVKARSSVQHPSAAVQSAHEDKRLVAGRA